MIAVDTNILVYTDREESSLHNTALRAVRQMAEGDEAWAIPIFASASSCGLCRTTVFSIRPRRPATQSSPWLPYSPVHRLGCWCQVIAT